MNFQIYKHLALSVFAMLFTSISIAQINSANALYSVVQQPQLTQQEQHYLSVIEKDVANFAWEFIQTDKSILENSVQLRLPFMEQEYGSNKAVIDHIEYRRDTDYSWFGTIEDREFASVNFVNNNGFIHGLIITTDGVWEIEPLSKDLQVLTYKDQSQYEREECADNEQPHNHNKYLDPNQPVPVTEEGDESGNVESLAGNCKIRLLVCYTDDVASSYADPVGHIQLATDNYNATNDNSGVYHDVEIARIMEVSYAETGNSSTDVNRFSNPSDGFMDQIHDRRNYYDADMACLILKTTGGCGRADDIGATASTAFQVTKYSCATGNLTYAHEFGHLLNARHDWYVDGTPGSNHGYVRLANNWRTCMAYNDLCSDNGTSCTRLQHWSNPAINYPSVGGHPTGISGGSQPSDNESAIDAYDNTAAGWQSYIVNKTFNLTDNIYDDETGHVLAETSITTSSTNPITYWSGSVGSYQAGSSITFVEGFWAKAGSDFEAVLDNCTDPYAPPPTLGNREDATSLDVQHSSTLELFPNPVYGQTTIAYDVTQKGRVIMEILDVNGRLIERISEINTHDTGKYRIKHNMEFLSAGTYFLRFQDEFRTEIVPFVKTSNF